MINTNTLPARNLQKSYKSIIQGVKNKKQVVILTTSNKPQAAIVSLEDLEHLRRAKAIQGAQEMLELAKANTKELEKLPADLRQKADEVLYSK